MSKQRIYLDNAATSWPKPAAVYDAVDRYQRNQGAPYGRGGYGDAIAVGRTVEQLRVELARFVNARDSSQLVFTYSGTDSLNLAIHGVLRPGDHVVTTEAEHNSVLRPLRFLEENTDESIAVTRVSVDNKGIYSAKDVIDSITPSTRLVSLIHASNVTGALQPVEQIGNHLARSENSPLFLLDAAQSIGHVPVDVQTLGCDFLAAPGHKGLLAPTGTGFLYVGERALMQLQPVRQGGTGTESEFDSQPSEMPARFESGNHNVPGLMGMAAGLEFVIARSVEQLRDHELRLMARLQEQLQVLPHVTIYGPTTVTDRVGLLSFNVHGMDPQEVAAVLDSSSGIQCRSGLHCSPLIHQALGTKELGGTLRVSVGPYSTNDQMDAVADLVSQLG